MLRILFFVMFVLNKTQICSTPMINLRLIPHFQHQLTTVNAGTHSTSHLLRKGTEIYTYLSKKSLANIKSPLDEIVASQRTENQNIKLNKNK